MIKLKCVKNTIYVMLPIKIHSQYRVILSFEQFRGVIRFYKYLENYKNFNRNFENIGALPPPTATTTLQDLRARLTYD